MVQAAAPPAAVAAIADAAAALPPPPPPPPDEVSNDDEDDDHFAVFGIEHVPSMTDDGSRKDDDENNDDDDDTLLRDPSAGVLSFHDGTEQALLVYIQNELSRDTNTNVITAIDNFCMSRHWMMNVGNEKGAVLDEFLVQCLDSYKDHYCGCCSSRAETRDNDPLTLRPCFVVVELGTYCGYSLLRMIRTIQRNMIDDGDRYGTFCIFTVDVDPKRVTVAKEMCRLAAVDDRTVEFVLRDPPADNSDNDSDDLATMIQHAIRNKLGQDATIDFLFLDHNKDEYLTDLRHLERASLIRANTHVCADNVIMFELEDYRHYVQQLQKDGVVQTQLRTSRVEYVTAKTQSREHPEHDMIDGLELTIYLKDPPGTL